MSKDCSHFSGNHSVRESRQYHPSTPSQWPQLQLLNSAQRCSQNNRHRVVIVTFWTLSLLRFFINSLNSPPYFPYNACSENSKSLRYLSAFICAVIVKKKKSFLMVTLGSERVKYLKEKKSTSLYVSQNTLCQKRVIAVIIVLVATRSYRRWSPF